jgi:very-short-patch-repair endonuclease
MPSSNARWLRRNSTDAERRLWSALRDRRLAGYRFRRQHPVRGFILDFACTKYQVAVEADGGQHVESQSDARRNAILKSDGRVVLRFWNNDVLTNTEGVVLAILEALRERQTLTRSQAKPAITLSRDAGEGLGSPS